MKFSNKSVILLSTVLSILCAANIKAQGLTPQQQNALRSSEYNSGTELSQRIREMQRLQVERQAEKDLKNKQEEQKLPEATEEKPATPKVRMYLEKLEIPDSEVLDREELDKIAANYEKKEIEIADLYDAANEINRLYARKGYLTTKAVIQPQKIVGGVVRITLLEGKLGEVNVVNNKVTKTSYIKDCLELKLGQVPNMNAVRHRIQRFNGTNGTILQIRMVAGKAPMTTDFYIVAIEPENRDSFNLFMDNAGKETSGEWRYGLTYSNVNASGVCDNLTLTALFAKTSETSLLNYNVPIDNKGNKIGISYSNNRMRISDGDMRDLDIRGKSRATGLTITHPSITTATKKENFNIEIQQQHSDTTILGSKFVHDDEHRFVFSFDSLKLHNNELIYVKPQFSYNEYKGMYESQYGTRFVLDALWQKYKTNGDTLSVRFNGQKSFDDDVSSADQYYLGGLYTVRGYDESGIGGDSGLNVRLDYSWHTRIKNLKFVTFFDWGRLSGDNAPDDKEIYSAGWGLEYRHKDLFISAVVGYALKRHINDMKVDASEIHVSAGYMF